LAPEELAWLNTYHKRVFETVGPLADTETRRWLKAATAKI
jgi:Xaa-Pro aminopeptidase